VHHGLFNNFSDKNIPLQKVSHMNYVLFLGERKTYKNFTGFVKGLRNLLTNDTSLHLICAGGGQFTQMEIELVNSLKILGQCHQVTPNDAQLKQLYQNALAFIFPSIYEGFGLPILESFEAQCPVILSNIEVFHEIGGDAAVYLDPESNEDIEEKISHVLFSTEKQSSMKNRGRERLKYFTADSCINKTLQVYKSLL
jgi:glycosyltransferase involved in cell wall biosynthesis